MNKEIIHNERLVTPSNLSDVVKLDEFVQVLNQKYHPEGSFGKLRMDKHLVSHLYENNIYFFLYGDSSDRKHLPCEIEEREKETLFSLRKAAYEALKSNYPKKPVFEPSDTWDTYDMRLKEQGFKNAPHPHSAVFRVGAANANPLSLEPKFTVKYYRCGRNKCPHFSTTYGGFQNQCNMEEGPALQFYEKWNPFHIVEMTIEEFKEMEQDLMELKDIYPCEWNWDR